MSARRDPFPEQNKPLYQFRIEDAKLIRTAYQRYDIRYQMPSSRTSYWIQSRHGIKTKSEGQLDRVLNNSLWTFDPDFRSAMEKFRQRAEADETMAAAMLESARRFRSDVDSVRGPGAFIETGGCEP